MILSFFLGLVVVALAVAEVVQAGYAPTTKPNLPEGVSC
jgi:hypothetical protein